MSAYVEEVRAIAQVLATLAEGGKEAFIWWLIADKVVPSVLSLSMPAAMVAAVAIIGGTIKRVMRSTSFGAQMAFELRDMVNPGRKGSAFIADVDEAKIREFLALVAVQARLKAASEAAAEK